MGIYKPEVGDKVWFWDDMGQLWDTGEVIAYGADRRLYFIQPDNENLPEFLVNYTEIHPISESKKVPSFWEAAKSYCRANQSLSEIVNRQEREIHSLQAQIDAFPYETGAPVGGKVAARIAEYRERAEKAESTAKQLHTELYQEWVVRMAETRRADLLAESLDATITERDAMTNRVDELEDQNRILKRDRDQFKIERDMFKADLAELKRIKRKANKRFRKQAKEDLRREG